MAEEAKVKYKVRPGKFHGLMNEYQPGDVVELTPSEAKPFADKLYRLGSSAEVSDAEQGKADAKAEADDRAAFEKKQAVKAKTVKTDKPKKGKKGDETDLPIEEKGDGFEDDEKLDDEVGEDTGE